MPPGATGPAARGTASSSNSNNYANISLNAMLNAPSRLSQPRLHRTKLMELYGSVLTLLSINSFAQHGREGGRCAQFRDFNPTIKVPGSLKRSLDMEFRMSGVETTLESVTTDVSGIKQDVSATRDMVAQFIQSFGAHMTTSTSAQASSSGPSPKCSFC
ncbi:hypothetical protein Bca52824_000379 [Brassica carinata]|uniref:Uncharacterized protein n=1 Tax=Brassica carinata TaxID=52824 RepID=A0A8X8B8V8_BRACI|nr:hypothetical protein Bca52824_000379 [Brassica carinata]